MSKANNTGTITFTTQSAVAVWRYELTGQLSDGMWENTVPHDHWQFWNRLDSAVGATDGVVTLQPWLCKKKSYAFNKLYSIIGERMVGIGRLGVLTLDEQNHRAIAQNLMNARTFAEFNERNANADWGHYTDLMRNQLDPKLAEAFFSVPYGYAELKKDIARIKTAMKTFNA